MVAANEIKAFGNLFAYFNFRRNTLRRARKDKNIAEKCRTTLGYDTCKSGVTPGDYFHHVELPYIYRHGSEPDAQIDLHRQQNEAFIHQKPTTEFSTARNDVPFVEKIAIWYLKKWMSAIFSKWFQWQPMLQYVFNTIHLIWCRMLNSLSIQAILCPVSSRFKRNLELLTTSEIMTENN